MSLPYAPGGRIVLGGPGALEVMRLTVDPTVGAGVPAPIGTLGIRDDGSLYTKIGAADTAWSLVGAGGGATINELWGPRITAHPADDEFTGNVLNAAWSQAGATALDFTTRPSPYVNPIATNRASFENLRDPDNASPAALAQNTWLRTQPAAGLFAIHKRLDSAAYGGAVPNALLCWARFRFAWRNAQGVGAAGQDIGLSFFEDTGAGFSFAVHATINLCNTQEGTANIIKPLFWGRNGAAVSVLSEGNAQNAAATNQSTGAFYSGYVALQRLSPTVYWAWVIDDGGRLCMGVYNNAGLATVNSVAIWGRCNNAAEGAPIIDTDYFRNYQGSDWLP